MKSTDAEADSEFEQVNEASALWQRSPDEITEEQYEDFYKHVAGDWEPPLAHTHFKIEGMQMFTGLLYVPTRQPFDLFEPEVRHGVRLYVRRVFIMDNAEELVPKWLRFVRGVVDSADLPLNVSRELLQDSRLVRTMRKQVTKKTLEMLQDVADNRPDDYADFWEKFGSVLKEGLHFEPEYSDRLAKLVRFESSESETPIGLQTYIDRMQDGQEQIYYAIGQSRMLLDGSPHLEALKAKGYEILYLTDNIDSWAIQGLTEFEGKTLVDAMNADLDLDEDADEAEEKAEELKPLTEQFQTVLADQVKEVRLSNRLADSPACLVVPEGGLAAHIERLLRAQQQADIPTQKRILELNPNHPLIEAVKEISATDSDAAAEWIGLIYDQALLAEGSPISDPPKFAKRFTELMQTAVGARQ
jgi:molecular chaperone HtpG